jgi:hypothetical protein
MTLQRGLFMGSKSRLLKDFEINLRLARALWPHEIGKVQLEHLQCLTSWHKLRVVSGDLQLLGGRWYITHSGLLRIAERRHCSGIAIQPVWRFCNPQAGHWAFKATVYKSLACKGFVGYGDADPSNVSSLVRGAEMRVAETRAVNRALRKAYGIGICSVEEMGAPPSRPQAEENVRKLPPQPANGNGQPKLRDQG